MHFGVAFVLSCITWIMEGVLFTRYVAYTDLAIKTKYILFFICLFFGGSLMWGSHTFLDFYGRYAGVIQNIFFTIFVGIFLLFSFTLIRDGLWIILHHLWRVIPGPLSHINLINLITLCVVFGCTLWAVYEGCKAPNVKELTLYSNKIKTEKTIAVLTDLHISRTTTATQIKQIVAQTNALNPDMIFLVGDTLDDDLNHIQSTAAELKKLSAPFGVFGVSGNHELYIGYDWSMQTLGELGIRVMDEKGISVFPDLFVAGIKDSEIKKGSGHSNNHIFTTAHARQFKILMAHTPTYFKSPLFDLEISGHTHGGQIWPFHFLVWLGNHHYFAGLYSMESAQIYVSRGTGQWGPQLRFLSPSEITLIHLKPKSAD